MKHHPIVSRTRVALAAALSIVAVGMLCSAITTGLHAQATSDGPGSKSTRQTVDTTSVLVQLNGEPLSTYVKTKPPPGKKIDFNSDTVKSYRSQLSALRNDFKQWLQANAPKAKVTGQYDISLNAVAVQLNGTSKSTIEKAPQVVRVEYQGLYYPNATDPDLALVHAVEAWNQGGGVSNAGAGVKIAIIDTGIDIDHPCFDDTGYAPVNKLGDPTLTNNKVIVAKLFNNKAVSRGYTAEAIQAHGTHVAGTAACNALTPAIVDGVSIPYAPSGVAPRALLGNYNIFPADVEGARSEDILNALEAAYTDGFDIANMSLGGGAAGIQDLLTKAVDDLDQANFISAVAAGNSGPGHYTIESPGSAARALTAGGEMVGHFIGTPVAVGRNTFGALGGGDFAVVTNDLTGNLGVVFDGNNLGLACSALPAGSLLNKIALISRGSCSFSTKIRNAQNAGAIAALIVNSQPGTPIGMASDGTANQPTIPAYMFSLADKTALVAANGASTTISASFAYFFNPANNDFMYVSSSQGPTDVDFRVKPDAIAPGQNVLSSIPLSFCGAGATTCWAFFNGTSMATPHLAGSAAVVLSQHRGWSAAQVRSAVVNTADQGVLKKTTAPIALETDVNVIGAGRDNVLSAVNASAALDPVSVSFGSVPTISGISKSVNVTVSNIGNNATYSFSVGSATGSGVSYSVSPASLSLGAGGSGVVTVTMTANKGASLGDHQAKLSVKNGSTEVAHAAVYSYIK